MYTSHGQRLSFSERLKVECESCTQGVFVRRWGMRQTVRNGRGESAKVRVGLCGAAWFCHQLPPPLHEVHVGRVRRAVPPRAATRGSDGLPQRTTRGARLVQDQGAWPLSTQGPQLPPSLADPLRLAVRAGGAGAHRRRDGLERPEPLAPLPPAGRCDPPAGAAPAIPQTRPADTLRRLHKHAGTLTRVCVGAAWFPLFFAPLPAQRGRLGRAGSRPCAGGARGARATGGPA